MTRRFAACLFLAALCAGCGTTRREQLQRVAKDWCETIRASQVIAVYPLTQDVQPGDVFLVQTPIDKQQEIYEEDGFLPLDNHLARLDPEGYPSFYQRSFVDGIKPPLLPKDWIKAVWKEAPSAAFPSYAFSATQSAGLNLAIPVSGVPVGLSLLGTQSANGTISLKDARTIGVDTESLYFQLVAWANDQRVADRQEFLANFGVEPGEEPRNFLRVITRIYLLGAIDVQLNDARSFGGGLDVGAARPVELFVPETPRGPEDVRRAEQETYLRGVQRLNAMSGNGAPTSTTGADPTLSAEEMGIREEARREARNAEIVEATKKNDDAREELAELRKKAEDSDEKKAVDEAEAELEDARHDLASKEEALAKLESALPPNPVAINAAKDDVKKAKAEVAKKEKKLEEAKDEYHLKHEKKIQEAAGKSDVTGAALQRLQGLTPGGSFRFTAASSRSVSMTERFDVPLVVGYLGFDVAIGVHGALGRPIPTYALLHSAVDGSAAGSGPAFGVFQTAANQNLYDALETLASAGDAGALRTKELVDRVGRFIPQEFPTFRIDRNGARSLNVAPWNGVRGFNGYLRFRQERDVTIRQLEDAASANQTVMVDGVGQSGQALRELARQFAATPAEEQAHAAAAHSLRTYWYEAGMRKR